MLGGIVPKESEIKGNNAQERVRERQTDRQGENRDREREGGREGRREEGTEGGREGGREAFLTSVLFLSSVLSLQLIRDLDLRQLSTDPIIVTVCLTTSIL